MVLLRLALCLLAVPFAAAFAPQGRTACSLTSTRLDAVNRRDALGLAFAAGLVAVALPKAAEASNPALETFKARKNTK